MKLVRYGPPGREKPGLIDADGALRDLSRKVKDIDGATLSPSGLAALKKLDTRRLPAVKGKPRLGPCVAVPSKFVAIGLNSPRTSLGADGFRSNESWCASPPER